MQIQNTGPHALPFCYMSGLLTTNAVCHTMTEITTALRHCMRNIAKARSLEPRASQTARFPNSMSAHPLSLPNRSTQRSRSWNGNAIIPPAVWQARCRAHPLGVRRLQTAKHIRTYVIIRKLHNSGILHDGGYSNILVQT